MSEKSLRIDALRGCAIFAVLQFHYGETFGLYAAIGMPGPIETVLSYGWAGVDLFFVLSAFLLTRNLLQRRGEAGVTEIFYRRRILRILPLYLLLLAAAAALIPILGADKGQWMFGGLAPFWVYGLFVQNFWAGLQSGWAGHFLAPTWSLAVEEHFYLLLPFLALRLNDGRLAMLAVFVIVAGPLVRMAVAGGVGPIAAQTWSFARIDSFGWGMLVALALFRRDGGGVLLMRFWIAAAAALGLLMAGYAIIHGFAGYCPLTSSVTALLAAALTLFAADSLRRGPPRGGAFFECAAWMGQRCYSIYLLHMPVAGFMALAIGRTIPAVYDAPSLLAVCAAAAVTFILSNLSYRFIERPFIDYGERRAAYLKAAQA